jgi:Family of unknown function (DUF6526)
MPQHYKNHRQTVFGYHVLTSVALLALLVGGIVNLVHSAPENRYSASLIILVALILASLYVYTRAFALKAQDRAVRAEEGLRYFILTGQRLDQRLSLSQVIALRFAPDEELPGLVRRAVDEQLTNDQIKRSIKDWRADTHRV